METKKEKEWESFRSTFLPFFLKVQTKILTFFPFLYPFSLTPFQTDKGEIWKSSKQTNRIHLKRRGIRKVYSLRFFKPSSILSPLFPLTPPSCRVEFLRTHERLKAVQDYPDIFVCFSYFVSVLVLVFVLALVLFILLFLILFLQDAFVFPSLPFSLPLFLINPSNLFSSFQKVLFYVDKKNGRSFCTIFGWFVSNGCM